MPTISLKGGTLDERQKLQALIDIWPENIKQLINDEKITFELGSHDFAKKDYDTAKKRVRVHSNLLARDAYNQTILFDTLLCAVGDDLPTINWAVASKEILALAKTKGQTLSRDQLDPSTILTSVVNAEMKSRIDQADFRKNCPMACAALEQLNHKVGRHLDPDAPPLPIEQAASIEIKIIKDPKYGASVTQADIDEFYESYKQWDDWIRQLVETSGITFVVNIDKPAEGKRKTYDLIKKRVDVFTQVDVISAKEGYKRQQNNQHAISKFGALLCVMHDQIPDVNWYMARKELLEAADTSGHNVASLFSDASLLASVEYTLAEGNGEYLEKKCPHAVQLYEKFIAAAKEHSQMLQGASQNQNAGPTVDRRKAWAEKYQATDKAFTINSESGVLTEPQREYFKKLNEMVGILGISPKEFDNQFRLEQRRQYIMSNYAAGNLLNTDSHPRYQKFIKQANADKAKEFYSKYGKPRNLPRPFKQGTLPDMAPDENNSDRKAEYLNIGQNEMSDAVPKLDQSFGIVEFNLPENAPEQDRNIHSREFFSSDHPSSLTVKEQITSQAIANSDNILQSYSNGLRSLQDLKGKFRERIYEKGKITYPTYADFFHAGIAEAILNIGNRRGITKELDNSTFSEIQQKLSEMETLWPQVVMPPDALIAGNDNQTQPSLKQQRETAIKAARDAKEREQLAAKEAAKPKPYTLPQLIGKYSDKPITQEIQALCKSLDCNKPQYKQLGDALFSAEIVEVIRMDLIGNTGPLKALIDAKKNPKTAAALEKARIQVETLFSPSYTHTQKKNGMLHNP